MNRVRLAVFLIVCGRPLFQRSLRASGGSGEDVLRMGEVEIRWSVLMADRLKLSDAIEDANGNGNRDGRMTALQERYLDTSEFDWSDHEALAAYGADLAWYQRNINWWIGDFQRQLQSRFPDTWHQYWPENWSDGIPDRCAGVCKKYPQQDNRALPLNWTHYRKYANAPDKFEQLQRILDEGRTTDEERGKQQPLPGEPVRPAKRWLLAVDVNYFVNKFFHSGSGLTTGTDVVDWLDRTIERLKLMGLTDVLCCLDSRRNHRKELTEDWEHGGYKPRPKKDPELYTQLEVAAGLLRERWCCHMVDGMEADDIMASAAAKFAGQVTLLVKDKDLRQCLSPTCNILTDITWEEIETSGDLVPIYHWYTAKPSKQLKDLRDEHARRQLTGESVEDIEYRIRQQNPNLEDDYGLTPAQWVEFQILAGDSTDGIKGCPGIGEKGAASMVAMFGDVAGVIAAAKAGDDRITAKKRSALIQFEEFVTITRKLVTMRTDLEIPTATALTC